MKKINIAKYTGRDKNEIISKLAEKINEIIEWINSVDDTLIR